MQLHAICDDCRHRHLIDFDPQIGPGSAFSDWLAKHPKHRVDFKFPRRSYKGPEVDHPWMDYLGNADVKVAYAASAAYTMTLASLAASSTLLAGQEGSAVSNASNKYLDILIAGYFKTAATNAQVGSINVAIVGCLNDTPIWPDVFDGTNSTETVSLQNVYDQVCKVAAQIATTATNALVWPFGPIAIAGLFGGVLPVQHVPFVSHNAETSTNVWSATEGDHLMSHTPIYATVI